MKLLSKTNEELARVDIVSGKKEPLAAKITIGDVSINTPEVDTRIEKVGDNLVVHVRVPGVVNFSVAIEPTDVGAMKGMMSKDVLKFVMTSFFK